MKVLCEISIGELLDKIAILHIKSIFLKRRKKALKHILYEKKLLEKTLKSLNLNKQEKDKFLSMLIVLNQKSWRLLERIDEKMKNRDFDEDFLKISYNAFRYNNLRYEVKNEINQRFGSPIKEIKSYKKYAI